MTNNFEFWKDLNNKCLTNIFELWKDLNDKCFTALENNCEVRLSKVLLG
jgi:hypothetical protein